MEKFRLPFIRLRFSAWLVAVLCFASLAAGAAVPVKVRGPNDLKKIAATLDTVSAAVVAIQFEAYSGVGQLKVGNPSAQLDSLILMRAPGMESDSAIPVDSTFIDIQKFSAGKLVLKGLAFHLRTPKSVLIAGDNGSNKENHNLLIDSCFIYADSLDGTFLSWLGDAGANIEFRNSWFVVKGAKVPGTSIKLSGGTLSFRNNLFNFPGTLNAAAVYSSVDLKFNTLNRTQLDFTGKSFVPKATYSITRNLFANHNVVSAFGPDLNWVASLSGFDGVGSSVKGNRFYASWSGFDLTTNSNVVGLDGNVSDPVGDKAASELWDWYTDARDKETGMLYGIANPVHYNVWPDSSPVFDTTLGKVPVKFWFKPAVFPRLFSLAPSLGVPELDSLAQPAAIRTRLPALGFLRPGPFQIDSVVFSAQNVYGKPLVFAARTDSGKVGKFVRQRSPYTTDRIGRSPYVNRDPKARAFVLADSGNTPKGQSVDFPTAAKDPYRLRFDKVDDAGMTLPTIPLNGPAQLPDSLRLLQVFYFTTSASFNANVTYGVTLGTVRPYASGPKDSLYWFVPGQGLQTAKRQPGKDSAYYFGTSPFNTGKDTIFNAYAYLVELLSIHPGASFRKDLPGASLMSASQAGYQLRWDTTRVDSTQFGSASLGYAFTWIGRGTSDALTLSLKSPAPEAQAFVRVPGKTEPDSLGPLAKRDSTGRFQIPITSVDSGKTFFVAVRFNVRAHENFQGTVDSVVITGLQSSTAGRLAFRRLALADARDLGANRDSVFLNTRFLGGEMNASLGLKVSDPYRMEFGIAQASDTANLETWYLAGGKWKRITGRELVGARAALLVPPSATHIVAVERFPSPAVYFNDPSLKGVPGGYSFTVNKADSNASIPIQAYCVEVRSLTLNRDWITSPCEPKAIGVPTQINLDTLQSGSAYRVTYFISAGKDTVRLPQPFAYPSELGWKLEEALGKRPDLNILDQGHWKLVALPVTDTLGKVLVHGERKKSDANEAAKKPVTLAMGIGLSSDGKTEFDSLADVGKVPLEPASAYLLAANHPLELKVGASVRVSPKPFMKVAHQGWNLIGNPYPVELNAHAIKHSKQGPMYLRELVFKNNQYSWDTLGNVLQPFRGVVYYLDEELDTLYIDLADTTPSPTAQAKVAATARVRVGIDAPWGTSSMALVRGAAEHPIPFLPVPNSGLELRVGGKGGYWIKPVDDLDRIDQSVEIRADRDGAARFALGEGGSGPAFALIDEATGAVYDAAAAAALPVHAGSQSYRLVAGDGAFVAERTHAFLAAAPAGIGLSQNYPNPARALTRINLDWPITRASDRRAALEVLDLEGRRLMLKRLDGLKVGRQVLELDASAWKPGLYVYRLVVTAGGRTTRLQKRMLVTP